MIFTKPCGKPWSQKTTEQNLLKENTLERIANCRQSILDLVRIKVSLSLSFSLMLIALLTTQGKLCPTEFTGYISPAFIVRFNLEPGNYPSQAIVICWVSRAFMCPRAFISYSMGLTSIKGYHVEFNWRTSVFAVGSTVNETWEFRNPI